MVELEGSANALTVKFILWMKVNPLGEDARPVLTWAQRMALVCHMCVHEHTHTHRERGERERELYSLENGDTKIS